MKTPKVKPPRFAPEGFVPTHEVSPAPSWVAQLAADYHGDGYTIERRESESIHALVVDERCIHRHPMPPGDWIIVYSYNETDGTNNHRLFVACKLH